MLYFVGADFKCDICFPKCSAQVPNFGHFRPKSIVFLLLTKFYLYLISKVMISNLRIVFQNFKHKFPNLGILDQEVLTF